MASKICGVTLEDITTLGLRQIENLADKIISDPNHFLHNEYKLLPSGRRYLIPRFKTKRASNSFVPYSIVILNKGKPS